MSSAVSRLLEEFGRDTDWFLKHYGELLECCEGEWVAVHRESVVDHDGDLTKLVERLRAKGLKPEVMVIEFVTKEPIKDIIL